MQVISDFDKAALDYHRFPKPGKLEISATKNMLNQRDLALAYSPGVAAACREISSDNDQARELTARSNLVGVITNGTAVLGLGNIGALASKPVMEGKAVLFKKFADIDVFDLELSATNVDEFVNAVAPLEPTFGGINLEDIKAPDCFEIERKLKERMNIPVFHDDQHGTAIVVCAAIRNGLKLANKQLDNVKLVCSGAGAAALACLNLLLFMGIKRENITVCDVDGVVYKGRTLSMDSYKSAFAQDTQARVLDDVIDGADIFLGLSAPNVITGEQVARMAKGPFILALANPDPEIHPDEVRRVRDDAIMATGRSDFPNQVNNVLCFPFLFRGALDVGATEINQEMQVACVDALANLALLEASDVVSAAYGGKPFTFGIDYLIPKPFDPRLITEIPPAVARAAMASGVATRPIEDFDSYTEKLSQTVFKSGLVMKPVFERVNRDPQRVVLAEGANDRVLNATQILIDDHLCHPILLGNRKTIEQKIEFLGLRLRVGEGFDVIDPRENPNVERHIVEYLTIVGRRGVSPSFARTVVQTQNTVLAALLVRCGDADTLVCGSEGAYRTHLDYIRSIIGVRDNIRDCSTVELLLLDTGTVAITDTHVTVNPTAEEVAETALMTARLVERFGMVPKVALLSSSNFGSLDHPEAVKMRQARELVNQGHPELKVEGEMHADAALSQDIRDRVFPDAVFQGSANVLVMPSLDVANITTKAVRELSRGVSVGPILMGMKHPVHVATESMTVRALVNLAAIAAMNSIDFKAGIGGVVALNLEPK